MTLSLSTHDEFRRLAQEHMQYSTRLDSLTKNVTSAKMKSWRKSG